VFCLLFYTFKAQNKRILFKVRKILLGKMPNLAKKTSETLVVQKKRQLRLPFDEKVVPLQPHFAK